MKFNKTYFFLFILLFLIEVCIAYFLKSGFIRHTFGDFLVVILLYCLIKSFINLKPISMALIVLIISFAIEFLQLTTFLEMLNLQDNMYAKLVLGNTFHFSDLVAYTAGVITIIGIESKRTATV
jgi:dynactin complex subunit